MKRMVRLTFGVLAAVLMVGAGRAGAAGPFEKAPFPRETKDRISFEVSLRTSDPFAGANAKGPGPYSVYRGEVFTLVVKAIPKPGFHTYPITQRADSKAQDEGGLTQLTFQAVPGLQPLAPLRESPRPEFHPVRGVGVYLVYDHEHPVTWTRDVLVLPDAKPGPRTLAFKIELQVCSEENCANGAHSFAVPLQVTGDEADKPKELPPALKERLSAKQPPIRVVPVPASVQAEVRKPPIGRGQGPKAFGKEGPRKEVTSEGAPGAPKQGLLALVITSMVSAFLMLLTPCVFPMIPITVSFFLKQSQKEHHNALLTALVYSGTIIIVLALAVLVLGGFIIKIADDPWTNLGLGLVLIFFALSLFGMYEIELPHFLSRFTSAREGRGGYLGAVFMALTFTITSFTCTGPFLGPLLVAAKEAHISHTQLTIAAFVYSATFAAPFFVLALFPSMLKALPKSGGWLNAVKVVMGFLELAAALKFLANMDAVLSPGDPWFFNYDTVLCAWIVLSAACGLYLLGLYRLPHDTPVEHVGVPRLVLATLFLGLALYMTPALWRKVPLGVVGENLAAFLPRDTAPRAQYANAGGGVQFEEPYKDYQEAWKRAVAENKDLFIDFTGVNCPNCRFNEINVFSRPDVRRLVHQYVVVEIYTDSVPKKGISREQGRKLGEENLEIQRNTFKEYSRPMYVLFRPDKAKALADGKFQGTELGRRSGKITDVSDFVKFLESDKPPKQVARRD